MLTRPIIFLFPRQESDLLAMRSALSFVRVQAEEWRVKMESAHREAQVRARVRAGERGRAGGGRGGGLAVESLHSYAKARMGWDGGCAPRFHIHARAHNPACGLSGHGWRDGEWVGRAAGPPRFRPKLSSAGVCTYFQPWSPARGPTPPCGRPSPATTHRHPPARSDSGPRGASRGAGGGGGGGGRTGAATQHRRRHCSTSCSCGDARRRLWQTRG